MKLFLLLIPSLIFCSPKGAQVSRGHAEITHHGSETKIETSHNAVIQWNSFSIANGESVRFVQPNSNSAVINQVSKGVSQIDGTLLGNGRVYLLNPNGVLMGKSGVISCAGFIASTLDFDTDACFKGGDLLFSGSSQEKIINCGKIEALQGDVLLLAKAVVNEGAIVAKKGFVGVAAAREVLLKPEGSQRLFIVPHEEAFLENKGIIEAARQELKADGNAYRLAMNQKGVVEATSFQKKGKEIVFSSKENAAFIGVPLFSGSSFQGGFDDSWFHQPVWVSMVPNQVNRIFAEMFQKLHTYDELLFNCKCFLFGYDKACYDQLFHPKGMVSSFDLFSEEQRCMLRQKYRNYELKYIESF